jgi:hypothetical protein
MIDTNEIKRGMTLVDNDPRMGGRRLTVTQIGLKGVYAKNASGRERYYAAHRIFPRGTVRRSGLTFLGY